MLKIIGDRILIKRIELDVKTEGGLYIPQTTKGQSNRAEIISYGERVTVDVAKGDIIIFDFYANCVPIRWEGNDYLIIKSSDVIAVEKK